MEDVQGRMLAIHVVPVCAVRHDVECQVSPLLHSLHLLRVAHSIF